jgi:hypothetical protein
MLLNIMMAIICGAAIAHAVSFAASRTRSLSSITSLSALVVIGPPCNEKIVPDAPPVMDAFAGAAPAATWYGGNEQPDMMSSAASLLRSAVLSSQVTISKPDGQAFLQTVPAKDLHALRRSRPGKRRYRSERNEEAAFFHDPGELPHHHLRVGVEERTHSHRTP